jgi:hypothetical protein
VIPAFLHAVVISLTIFCKGSSSTTSDWPSTLSICSSNFMDSSLRLAFMVSGNALLNSLLSSITLIITISELAIFEIYDAYSSDLFEILVPSYATSIR